MLQKIYQLVGRLIGDNPGCQMSPPVIAMSTDTRARLLAEAEQLLRRVGYAAFSYADLAAAIGIRKASIHHHFPTKQDLAAAVVDAALARFTGRLHDIEAMESSAVARLHAYGGLFSEGCAAQLRPLCCALAADLAALPPAIHARTRAYFDLHLVWLGRIVEAGIARREIVWSGNAAGLAVLILGSLEGGSLLGRVWRNENEVAAGLHEILVHIAAAPIPGG